MKCPKCKKEIDTLRHEQSGLNTYDCWAEERTDCKGAKYTELDYQHDEFTPDCEYNVWNCPECKETLFTNGDAALDFLKGAPKVISEFGNAPELEFTPSGSIIRTARRKKKRR